MKKHLILALILTIMFPAYCFANPQTVIPTEREIFEEIMLIIEDGVVEEEEVISFLERMNLGEIISCVYFFGTISLILILMGQLDFSGSLPAILLDVITLFAGLYVLLLIVLLEGETGDCLDALL
jgi:hypothetical protein